MNPDGDAVDKYIAGFPPEARGALEEVRALVRASAPEATEKISYGVPTFVLNGYLVHFGGYKKHIGFYPTSSGIEAFKEELKSYKSSRGAVQFPLDRAMPRDLIRRMVEFRVRENAEKAPK